MRRLRAFLLRVAGLLHKGRRDREFAEEIESHLRLHVDDNLRAGMAADEALRQARLRLGGVEQVKESYRDRRGVPWFEHLAQDLRYSFRVLRKSPGFTAVAAITLALGIGANSAIFTVVEAVLLRPLPYRDPGRLVVVLHHGENPVAPANYLDWRQENHVFADAGAAEYWTPNLAGTDRPEKVWALRITASLLPTLGVSPLMGRAFLPAEEGRGADHEVILSYGSWQTRFGGGPEILGRRILLDGENYTVVGVMPPEFRFAPFWATKAELWAPLSLADRAQNREGNSLRIFARLKSGVSLEQARAGMAAISAHLEAKYPGTNRDVRVIPLNEKVVGEVRPALLVLLGAVGLVLLIACANVAHMLLSRAAARQREISVRMALGAGRARMIRQFLTESLLLATLGCGTGLLLALGGVRALVALAPSSIPRLEGVGLDQGVVLFTLCVSLFAAVAVGIAPAIQGSALDLNESLKEAGRGSSGGRSRSGLRRLLMISEFSLAMVLLIGAGLMIRSFLALRDIDPGFNPRRVVSMVVSLTGTIEAQPSQRAAFFQQTVANVAALPGIRAASAINHLPLAGDAWVFSFRIEGRPIPRPGDSLDALYRVVLPKYFSTMGIPIVRGRDIQAADTLSAPGVVVVNEHLARQYWPAEDPIGERITLEDAAGSPVWVSVVGIAKDAKQMEWTSEPANELYQPYLQSRQYLLDGGSHVEYLTLVARTAGDPAAMSKAMEREVRRLDRNVSVSEVQTMDQVVADAEAQPRFALLLLGSFAAVALVLAAVGIYGVMSYAVSRRAHEIGIRIALGALRGDVTRLVMRETAALVVAGAALGLPAAFALTHLMRTLFYGVGPGDGVTFAAVPLLLTAVALAAGYVPARRATRIDPIIALRAD